MNQCMLNKKKGKVLKMFRIIVAGSREFNNFEIEELEQNNNRESPSKQNKFVPTRKRRELINTESDNEEELDTFKNEENINKKKAKKKKFEEEEYSSQINDLDEETKTKTIYKKIKKEKKGKKYSKKDFYKKNLKIETKEKKKKKKHKIKKKVEKIMKKNLMIMV